MWFNKADVLRQESERVVEKALRASGWKHTCKTPGSVWMWEKELDGVVYRMPFGDASSVQEVADRDAYFDKFPDELGD